MSITRVRGMNDVLPEETPRWQAIERAARETARRYAFGEVRTPVLEMAELFDRGVGDATDIVEHEMYRFRDRGEREVALRPEGTASVMRALLEAGRIAPDMPPQRVYYLMPLFRYERPQAGRLRQHHQFGVELVGTASPRADAEVIALFLDFVGGLGLNDLEVHLNSIGDAECRPVYRQALVDFVRPFAGELCGDCRRRIDRNPLRLFDCHVEADRHRMAAAPRPRAYLCEACRNHHDAVRAMLAAAGRQVVDNDDLVRGLDYYTRTVFEVVDPALGREGVVGGGGRYDGLIAMLGGPDTPSVGFGLGLERLQLVLERYGLAPAGAAPPDVYLAALGGARDSAYVLAGALRAQGLTVMAELDERSLKAQLRSASRSAAPFALILGERDVAEGTVAVRDLADGSQVAVARSDAARFVQERRVSAPSASAPADPVREEGAS